jgi:hypothetical protein
MPDSGTITNYFASGARFARNVFMYDFEVAVATYWATVARWPAARITLRQGARVVERNWSTSESAT